MKIAYETPNYTIKKIPLNWRIDIKKSLVLKNPSTGIERDWYEWDGNPLQWAIELAERVSIEHFRPMTKEEIKNAKKNSKRMIEMNSITRICTI